MVPKPVEVVKLVEPDNIAAFAPKLDTD